MRLCGPQGRSGLVRKSSPPPGFDPRTSQPLASHHTEYTTPAHSPSRAGDFSPLAHWQWSPLTFLFSGLTRAVYADYSLHGVKLNTPICYRWSECEKVILSSPYTLMTWSLIQHRDNSTFNVTFR
jgi:hypothetical protein